MCGLVMWGTFGRPDRKHEELHFCPVHLVCDWACLDALGAATEKEKGELNGEF